MVGLTATVLAPDRPAWRVLPFTDSSAQHLSTRAAPADAIGAQPRLPLSSRSRQGRDRDALASVGALVLATAVALLALPVLSNRAWQAARPDGSTRPADGRRHLVVASLARC